MSDESAERDDALMARSITEPEVFRLVFDRHFDAVWSFARQRLSESLADDTANETFTQAFAARERYHGSGSARPWLLGIASNLCARHWRKESRRLRAYALTGEAPQSVLDEDGLIARIDAADQASVIAAALAELRPEDRETLLLAALAGLDNQEIAEALGITPNAVAVRLSRIRARLAPLMKSPTSGGFC